jgi:hypothetical protein
MLLIVFGEGASYDAVPDYPPGPGMKDIPRLPLANDLFSSRRYASYMSRFQRCLPIIPYLQNQSSGITVERVLQGLQDEAVNYTERFNQLAALRYYLQLMISDNDEKWCGLAYGITNHLTMLDQIRSVQGDEQVCIVTFNYDRIIEIVLEKLGIKLGGIDDYVSNKRYIIVKLHGSVNWGREIGSHIERVEEMPIWELVGVIIDHAHELDISSGEFQIVKEQPICRAADRALYPAIAIPLETKTGYECPPNHVDRLQTALADVDKIIIVGWRAADLPFAEMLAQRLKGDPRTFVVAESTNGAQESIDNLRRAGVPGRFTPAEYGFTQSVRNRDFELFLLGSRI